MARELSRRRFVSGCCAAGAGALTASGLTGSAAAGGRDRSLAAPPETRWNRTYEQGANAETNAVASANDGGFVAVGTAERSGGNAASEAWLYKVDAAGDLVWQRTFSEEAVTTGNDVTTADDGFLFVGDTREQGAQAQSGIAVRVGPDGTERWRTVLHANSGATDTIAGVDTDSDGRFFLAGSTSRFDDAWVALLTSEGDIDWNKSYGPGNENYLHGAVAVSDGGYLAVGGSTDTSGDVNGWLSRIGADGTQNWSQRYKKDSNSATNPKDNFNVFYDVAETDDGFMIVGANAMDPETNDRRGWLFKANINGGRIWDKRYSENTYTELKSVIDGDLQYYVVGETAGNADGEEGRGYAANIGIEGSIQWKGTYDGAGSSEFSGVAMSDAGGLVCLGSTAASAGGDSSGWGVKVGGERFGTPIPSPTPTDDETPADRESTPTFTPTPTNDETPTDVATATSTATPAGGGSTDDGTETATPADDESGGLSPAVLGIGAAILALGGGGLLYNRLNGAESDEDVPDPDDGAAAADTDDGDDGPDDGTGDTEDGADSDGDGADGAEDGDDGDLAGDTADDETADDETADDGAADDETVQGAQTVIDTSSGTSDGDDGDADAEDGDGSLADWPPKVGDDSADREDGLTDPDGQSEDLADGPGATDEGDGEPNSDVGEASDSGIQDETDDESRDG